jgi:hypothetical protein
VQLLPDSRTPPHVPSVTKPRPTSAGLDEQASGWQLPLNTVNEPVTHVTLIEPEGE